MGEFLNNLKDWSLFLIVFVEQPKKDCITSQVPVRTCLGHLDLQGLRERRTAESVGRCAGH